MWKELGDPVHAGAAAGPGTFCVLAGSPGRTGSPGWVDPDSWTPVGAMEWFRPMLGSLKHLNLDSLLESELPPDLYPYLAGQAVRSRGCRGPGVGGASFLCFPAGVTLSPLTAFLHCGEEVEGRFVRLFYPLCLTTAHAEVSLQHLRIFPLY